MSREARKNPPRNRLPDAVSGGTSRRSRESTMGPLSDLFENGPAASTATSPPIAIRGSVPTVASRPTINRRMASLRSVLEVDEIRPDRLHGVKHRRCKGVEPVVAYQHGARQAATQPQ